MDSEMAAAIGYASAALAAWPIGKYAVKPSIEAFFDAIVPSRMARKIISDYRASYDKTIAEKARVSIELGRAGRSPADISEIMDKIPFPTVPKAESVNN